MFCFRIGKMNRRLAIACLCLAAAGLAQTRGSNQSIFDRNLLVNSGGEADMRYLRDAAAGIAANLTREAVVVNRSTAPHLSFPGPMYARGPPTGLIPEIHGNGFESELRKTAILTQRSGSK